MSSTRRVLLLLCLLIAGPSLAQVDEYALKRLPEPAARAPFVPADTASFSGSNAAGAEWARPFADGACCSGLGPVRWVAQQFFISANDTCNVRSVQAGGWDGYLFVYRSPFNAATPTANFVAGDDDGAGGIGTSDIDGVALTGGVAYTVVTTGFGNGDAGNFTNTIACPSANVTLGTPAPASVDALGDGSLAVLALLLGLLGVGAFLVPRH